jgi:hypothetical protein
VWLGWKSGCRLSEEGESVSERNGAAHVTSLFIGVSQRRRVVCFATSSPTVQRKQERRHL